MNLTAFESRFLRICCKRFESLVSARGKFGGEIDVEWQVLVFGHVSEIAIDRVAQTRERNLFDFDADRAGFDLRKIENVVDQIQQVRAGRIDIAGEIDLLGQQIAGRIVGQLLAEDENRVERRAQLVRHVGQKLGLVLRGQRQFGRLFLKRAAGLFHFAVLAFHLGVLLGEQLGLGRQLLVRLLQFGLARLQLDGQLLAIA